MPRNNQKRTAGTRKKAQTAPTQTPAASVLDFVTPTEFVDLPSQGRFYDQDHPLHGQDAVEIRFMTAKDEDILTSQTLLRKGMALEKLLQSLVLDKNIKPSTLLTGDRSAILVAARATAYGELYETEVTCPSCAAKGDYAFNLREGTLNHGNDWGTLEITETSNDTFLLTLPVTQVVAEIRPLTGADENTITSAVKKNKKNSFTEKALTSQITKFIVSLNDDENRDTIYKFVDMMPAADSYHLRKAYRAINPTFDLTQNYECSSCGYEQEMEVPITATFFWPNR